MSRAPNGLRPGRTAPPTVISASRRTDIPAFYMPWFMAGIARGFFTVENPFNHCLRRVPAGAEEVHTIVFWSKNFGPFLAGGYGQTLRRLGYGLYFNFTLNSTDRLLEPRVPPLEDRLEQMDALAQAFGPAAVAWRFDPICFYRDNGDVLCDNLADFGRIAQRAGALGITRCITSFRDDYAKIARRTAHLPGMAFWDPPTARKIALLLELEKSLTPRGIHLETCCESQVMAALPPAARISPASCIPGALLMGLYGGRVSGRKDGGQRVKKGCSCSLSSDIGDYRRQPCFHNCLYCYAQPSAAAAPATTAAQGLGSPRRSC
jgi:hypothetical protein